VARADSTHGTAKRDAGTAAKPAPPDLVLQFPKDVPGALDSCAMLEERNPPGAPADTPSGKPSAAPISNSGEQRTFGRFTFFVPNRLHVAAKTSMPGGMSLGWDDCQGCRLGVTVERDTSGKGVAGIIAGLVEEQRQVDSANHDPKAEAGEFDVLDGPPTRVSSAAGRGYLLENDCGDCGSTTLMYDHAGYIGSISFGGDDDIPSPARHDCEMNVLARTFVWKE
jgi:hypothetical protein